MIAPRCPDCDLLCQRNGERWVCIGCGQLVAVPASDIRRAFGPGVGLVGGRWARAHDADLVGAAAHRLGLDDPNGRAGPPAPRRKRRRPPADEKAGAGGPPVPAPAALDDGTQLALFP